MTTHRYSVVMMTYNQEEFVGEALKAILPKPPAQPAQASAAPKPPGGGQ